MTRREFLEFNALFGAAALTGCATEPVGLRRGGKGAPMQGFRCAPLKRVRIAIAGMGGRGTSAMYRLAQIPGCSITGLCDLRQSRIDVGNVWLKAHGLPVAKGYVGPEAYKALCAADDVDVVYVAGSWQMHEEVGLCAVRSGKHTFVEVPAAMTLDGCWDFVESAEKAKVHCMMLENCCYGEEELLALNLCRKGLLGELVHGEAAYIHDLRASCYNDPEGEPGDPNRGYYQHWRLMWNKDHKGNQYPTHGLGPVCQYLNVNRGDRLDCLCSMETDQFNFERYARERFGADDWHAKVKVQMGDMNSTVIRTVKGKTILVQHDVSSPRPYSRLNLISGTRGILKGYPLQFGFTDKSGAHVSFFSDDRAKAMMEKYRHPLVKTAGDLAKTVGGHGGMDYLMDLRWVYCLQNGLAMDMDVYDLATWSSICELSERSVRGRKYMDVPDFTRGGWKTAEPLGIVDMDLTKMDFKAPVKAAEGQMSV